MMNETIEERKPRFCVIGAGHGGSAMAAHLSLNGFDVSLYNRSEERIGPVKATGGIVVVAEDDVNVPTGFAPIPVITTNMGEALAGADIAMVVIPATTHSFVAKECAPHLRDGQIVVLNPGRTGGALEFLHVLRQWEVTAKVIVAEAQTFLFASRALNPGKVKIFGVKNSVPVAAIPAYQTPCVVKALRVAFPQFAPGDNVMKTSLDNIGAVFHPAIMVLNTARIEDTHGDFQFYVEGVTPSVAQVLEAVDAERVTVSEAMGFHAVTAREWLYIAYDAVGRNLHEAMHANPGYRGIQAPQTIHHRYLNEDVPMSLVPIFSMGEMLSVSTPAIRGVIELAKVVTGNDYWAEGRTVERLGLAGLTLREVQELVMGGEVQPTPHTPVEQPVVLDEWAREDAGAFAFAESVGR